MKVQIRVDFDFILYLLIKFLHKHFARKFEIETADVNFHQHGYCGNCTVKNEISRNLTQLVRVTLRSKSSNHMIKDSANHVQCLEVEIQLLGFSSFLLHILILTEA